MSDAAQVHDEGEAAAAAVASAAAVANVANVAGQGVGGLAGEGAGLRSGAALHQQQHAEVCACVCVWWGGRRQGGVVGARVGAGAGRGGGCGCGCGEEWCGEGGLEGGVVGKARRVSLDGWASRWGQGGASVQRHGTPGCLGTAVALTPRPTVMPHRGGRISKGGRLACSQWHSCAAAR